MFGFVGPYFKDLFASYTSPMQRARSFKGMGKTFYSKYARVVPVRTTRKIGRNEQCPCRSGLKWKRCCIDKAVIC